MLTRQLMISIVASLCLSRAIYPDLGRQGTIVPQQWLIWQLAVVLMLTGIPSVI